ncbi:type III-B CRISPR module-associated Cmr3 family protein [Spirulina sp. 06S082]|uniref:type III-B CRISPR module-associated Cmr3 family protein n=1 Tax=Spirulina sp. 06S082 TaxID=3110248 RepID=UPI002B1F8D54|nr:type III-B CRISPR module-associated Cmr3 family protein [Spirulina sp. 06S082]MEA5471118.1 type III-B CRISPR module-associated Cmr3 family protein [Spirulina sp. 06S082]
MQVTETQNKNLAQSSRPAFQYLVIIEPLGLLYGSAGPFLSPENLVGRSGQKFPPAATALSGICAAALPKAENGKWSKEFEHLQLAGPFWGWDKNPQNFYVPTPFNCLVEDGKIKYQLKWRSPEKTASEKETHPKRWLVDEDQLPDEKKDENTPVGKFTKGSWLAIDSWPDLNAGKMPPVETIPPWKFMPHLHPRLKEGERIVDQDSDRGSLFLENAVQLDSNACLVYLCNAKIEDGCYRFGGEGHLVELRCEEIGETVRGLLDAPIENSFALITPGIWGSNDYSYRAPRQNKQGELLWGNGAVEALLTERPTPLRHRRGSRAVGDNHPSARLSRGRYAVPPGSVYVLEKPLNLPWQNWPDEWFPKEGTTFKRWGSALSLPLSVTGE